MTIFSGLAMISVFLLKHEAEKKNSNGGSAG